MGTIIVRLRATDFFDWHWIFQQTRGIRRRAGISNERVYRGIHEGNEVVVVIEARNNAAARDFVASAQGRAIYPQSICIEVPVDGSENVDPTALGLP